MNHFFAKRHCCASTRTALGALCFLLVSFAGFGQTRYTWQSSVSGALWADGNNWSPARPTPNAADILVFDGALTPTVSVALDFSSPQTIGQLLFINKVQATLNTDANRKLTLGALPPAAGLQLEAGSLVKIVGTSGGAGLALQLASGARATIAGRLEFTSATTSSSTHTLSSGTTAYVGTAEAITFLSGSYFKAGPKFTSSPFGSLKNNAGTVVLLDGATCEQASGTTPFGGNTYDALVCKAGSTFLYTSSSNTDDVSLSGHTFGHLVLNTIRPTVTTTYSSGITTILNDLTVQGGGHTIDVAQLDLKGNLYLNGGSLNFVPQPGNNLTLTLSSTVPQTIGGIAPGTLTMGPNVTLVLNNAAGLVLQHPVQVNGNLKFTRGLLTTTAAYGLTLGPGAAIPIGSDASFVNGPLSWLLATTTPTNLSFPIGSDGAYRPLTLAAQQTDAAGTRYTAQQFNQAPTARVYPTAAGSLQRVSRVRYFNVTNNGATNFNQGTITLTYGIDDKVDAPAKLRIAKSDNAGNWLDLGGTGTGAPVGSITSTVPFTSFGDFVLASTEASGAPGNNPLPVVLTSFGARRHPGGVRLEWATASELNNSRFEVERSAAGHAFGLLASVRGQGSSATSHVYSYLDEANAAGVLYYRLRQVDEDGTARYSPVAAVGPGLAPAGVFPNPAHQQISFSAEAGDNYRLLNVLGQSLLAGRAVAGLNALEMSGLRAGAYYLEVVGSAGRERFQFFKN